MRLFCDFDCLRCWWAPKKHGPYCICYTSTCKTINFTFHGDSLRVGGIDRATLRRFKSIFQKFLFRQARRKQQRQPPPLFGPFRSFLTVSYLVFRSHTITHEHTNAPWSCAGHAHAHMQYTLPFNGAWVACGRVIRVCKISTGTHIVLLVLAFVCLKLFFTCIMLWASWLRRACIWCSSADLRNETESM